MSVRVTCIEEDKAHHSPDSTRIACLTVACNAPRVKYAAATKTKLEKNHQPPHQERLVAFEETRPLYQGLQGSIPCPQAARFVEDQPVVGKAAKVHLQFRRRTHNRLDQGWLWRECRIREGLQLWPLVWLDGSLPPNYWSRCQD